MHSLSKAKKIPTSKGKATMNDMNLLIGSLAETVDQLKADLAGALSRISVLENQLATPLEEPENE